MRSTLMPLFLVTGAALGCLVNATTLYADEEFHELVRVDEPTEDSLATAEKAIRDGLVWLVFHDGLTYCGTEGWKFIGRAIQFKGVNGTLMSVRTDEIDLEGTEKFNELVRSGYYVEREMYLASKINFRPLTEEERRLRMARLEAQGIEAAARQLDAELSASCAGLSGINHQLCRLTGRLGQPSAEEKWELEKRKAGILPDEDDG